MTELDEIRVALEHIDGATRRRIVTNFEAWWSNRAIEARELLHDLAVRARSSADATDVLLELLDRHGVARPAIRRLLISEQDVDDAEQATLAVVATRLDQFEGRAQFTTWLHQVATNESKMLIRSRSRRPAVPLADSEPAPFLARLSTIFADRDLVERALAQLPEPFREVITLREVHRLDYDEIAAQLDVPVGTVRSRLSRARALLVDSLRE
jgi:RNA polymerase sigma-70 factor, ECF subfamily